MPQAPTAPSLSPAAKKLQHVINTKLPIAHDQEAIGDVVSDVCDVSAAPEVLDVLHYRQAHLAHVVSPDMHCS